VPGARERARGAARGAFSPQEAGRKRVGAILRQARIAGNWVHTNCTTAQYERFATLRAEAMLELQAPEVNGARKSILVMNGEAAG
jgi:hypothetical protein